MLAPPSPPSFRRYIISRQYDFGRSGKDTWSFIAMAKGEEDLLKAASWAELKENLLHREICEGVVEAARKTWVAYRAHIRGCR